MLFTHLPPLSHAAHAVLCVRSLHINQNIRVQETRAGFSGSVSIPSITKNRAEPGRSMSASSGLGIREYEMLLYPDWVYVCCLSLNSCPRSFGSRLVISERQRSTQGAVGGKLRIQTPNHDLPLRELPVLWGRDGLW